MITTTIVEDCLDNLLKEMKKKEEPNHNIHLIIVTMAAMMAMEAIIAPIRIMAIKVTESLTRATKMKRTRMTRQLFKIKLLKMWPNRTQLQIMVKTKMLTMIRRVIVSSKSRNPLLLVNHSDFQTLSKVFLNPLTLSKPQPKKKSKPNNPNLLNNSFKTQTNQTKTFKPPKFLYPTPKCLISQSILRANPKPWTVQLVMMLFLLQRRWLCQTNRS